MGLALLSLLAAGVVRRVASHDRWLAGILLAAFLLRAAVAVTDQALGLFPKADQNGYNMEARLLAEAWWSGTTTSMPWASSIGSYVHTIAPLFFAFGPHPLLPRILSALFGLGSTFMVHHIAKRTTGRGSARVAAMLYAVYPTAVYIQSETFRDPLITLLILSAIASSLDGLRGGTLARLGLIASLGGLSLLRVSALAVVLVPVVVLIVLARIHQRGQIHEQSSPSLRGPDRPLVIRPTHVLLVLGAILAAVALAGYKYVGLLTDMDALTWYRDAWAHGGSAYLANRSFDGPLDVLLFLPLGALYFMFAPFPWMVHNGYAAVAALHNVVLAYPLALLGAWHLRSGPGDGRLWALVLFVAVGAALFGLIEGNAGTALRHRTQFDWVVLLLAAPYVATLAKRRPMARGLAQRQSASSG